MRAQRKQRILTPLEMDMTIYMHRSGSATKQICCFKLSINLKHTDKQNTEQYKVSILEELGISMRLNKLPQSLIPVYIRVVFTVLQVPATHASVLGYYILLSRLLSMQWHRSQFQLAWNEIKMYYYLRASFLNFSISWIMRQKLGLIALLFCAKRPEMPLRLPHSHLLPLVPNCTLTEKDMSDLSISTPSPSNHSSMFGYVTCHLVCLCHKLYDIQKHNVHSRYNKIVAKKLVS